MLVNNENLKSVLDALISKVEKKSRLAFDTETTGLRPYHGDKPFSVIVGDDKDQFYFNFLDYGDGTFFFPDYSVLEVLFGQVNAHWYAFNAKFDMAMLESVGVEVVGDVWCCQAMERVVDSEMNAYCSLDELARNIGSKKDDGVLKWFKDNKIKKRDRKYTDVPLDIIVPYGLQDVAATYMVGEAQFHDLIRQNQSYSSSEIPSDLSKIINNEKTLLRTVYEMEKIGVKIDLDFCERAKGNCNFEMSTAMAEFCKITGHPFKPSRLLYEKVFESEKERWVYGSPTRVKGEKNPRFDARILATFDHPAAKAILNYSAGKANYNFYEGFIRNADAEGIIHTSFNQFGCSTGRFSSSNPNLQNITKAEGEEVEKLYTPRRAIIPREGNVFHMLDYDQMEYRLMLHYAANLPHKLGRRGGVLSLIEDIRGGKDVHQATADIAGISRRHAKTANFAILYGAGNKQIASTLGITEWEAGEIRNSIYRAAPEVKTLINEAGKTAKRRGFIVNWYGRRCKIPDPNKSYKAPNYLIQSGTAEIVKISMNKINKFLRDYDTNMVLTIHDELVFEGPKSESTFVIPEIKKIMESVFVSRQMPLTCGVDHSEKSLADKTEGVYREFQVK